MVVCNAENDIGIVYENQTKPKLTSFLELISCSENLSGNLVYIFNDSNIEKCINWWLWRNYFKLLLYN